jgi:signal transduction histidine kinase
MQGGRRGHNHWPTDATAAMPPGCHFRTEQWILWGMVNRSPRTASDRLQWAGGALAMVTVAASAGHRQLAPAALLVAGLYATGALRHGRWPMQGRRSRYAGTRLMLVVLLGAAALRFADPLHAPLLLACTLPLLLECLRQPSVARVALVAFGPALMALPTLAWRPEWMVPLQHTSWLAAAVVPPLLTGVAVVIVADAARARRVARDLVEQQLRARDRQIRERSALGAIAEPVLLIDRDFRILGANPAAEEMFEAELAGRFLRELVRAPEGQDALPDDEPQMGTFHAVETYLASGPRRGERWSLDLRRLPESRDDSTCWIGVLHRSDQMLEQVRLGEERHRRLQQSNRTRSEFLRLMSYELRTPLHAINGFAGLLQRDAFGQPPAVVRERAAVVERTGRHMQGILDDVRDFVRLGERPSPALTTFDLAATTASVARMVSSSADHKGVHLELDIPDQLVEAIGDPRMTTQVLLNLATNAIQFTPPGGQVTVSARRSSERAEVQVEDTGVGIPWSEQARVFEPLSQSRYVAPWKAGSGMGLAIARRLAELQGGTIALHSRPGQGSTFVLRLDTDTDPTGSEEPLLDQLLVTDEV